MLEDSPRPIRFVFRGQTVEVPAAEPTRSVLQWLREDARACGSKEGCAEGDCGACTVIVAELADAVQGDSRAVVRDGVALRPVNACIRFLPTLDGKALLTVEDLAGSGPDATLHPAQQALLDTHGSQCGFCTPGFAVSMAISHERHRCSGRRPGRAELADDLAGNLCRCTGYRPILDAAERMGEQPQHGLALEGLADALRALQTAPALDWPGRYHAPRRLDDLAALRVRLPEARLVAGATDVGLWVTKQLRSLGDILWLGDVAELRQMRVADGGLSIGAAVPLEDAWHALARRWPALTEMGRRFAGPPVRHAGTLVGNLANGSPIGDSAPALIALGARLRLRRGARRRELPLQDFYLDYMKNALEAGEFVEAVWIPADAAASAEGWTLRAWKISKRFDCDISAVSAGLAIRLQGDAVVEARLAFGGMAGIVKRAAAAEAAMQGQPWDEATLARAMTALDTDFSPLSDLRASAGYRRLAARGLLQRLWLETRTTNPLPADALRAFAGTH
ncbi:MAG: xanthine dehydrogenase small subunit [Burkholderiales bacterium]|nr:xanthine dehydrogenase small subunit [Burkholderiales bacterium]